jgi:hypothetical protein
MGTRRGIQEEGYRGSDRLMDSAEVMHLNALLSRRDELLREVLSCQIPYPLRNEIIATVAPPRTMPSDPFWIGSKRTRDLWRHFMETKPNPDQVHAATKVAVSEREDALKFLAISERLG